MILRKEWLWGWTQNGAYLKAEQYSGIVKVTFVWNNWAEPSSGLALLSVILRPLQATDQLRLPLWPDLGVRDLK